MSRSVYLWWGGSLQASISGLEVLRESLVCATLRGGPMFLMVEDNCSMCFSWSKISCIVRDRWDLKLVWAEFVSAMRCWNDLEIQNMTSKHIVIIFIWCHSTCWCRPSAAVCCCAQCWGHHPHLPSASETVTSLLKCEDVTRCLEWVITLRSLQVVLWEVRPSFRDAESCVNLLDAAVEINSPSAYFKM